MQIEMTEEKLIPGTMQMKSGMNILIAFLGTVDINTVFAAVPFIKKL